MNLVIVEWQDSRQPDGGWQWADERGKPEPVRCLTVGWLLQETDDALLVVQNLGDVSSDRLQFSGGTEIARRQIVQLKEITCPSWVKKVSEKTMETSLSKALPDPDSIAEVLLVARHYLASSSNLIVTDLPEKDDGTMFKTDNDCAIKMIDALMSAYGLDTSRVCVPRKTFLSKAIS